MQSNEAKKALDKILNKSRVHFYKPIQIAEILYQFRLGNLSDLSDLESYRGTSKRWRDIISRRLVGRISTSSARFQDNLFEDNAVPPEALVALGQINNATGGLVEAYVYRQMLDKFAIVRTIRSYIANADPDTFSLNEFVNLFESRPGLRRSIDKVYEITVYALFSTIVRELKAQVTLEILIEDQEVLADFERFIAAVLGLDKAKTRLTMPAALYRVGVTNAADRGLDMWANFGTAVQVKHLTLNAELVEEIADNIIADGIVIVCLDSESEAISSLLEQVGWGTKIRGIITLSDLDHWYKLSLSPKYRSTLGKNLLADLIREFDAEFPSNNEIEPFMNERGYSSLKPDKVWS